MLRKAKLTNEQRISAVEEYLNGKSGSTSIAKKYGIHESTFMEYVRRAKSEGIDSLRVGSKNKKYSKATKVAAVEDYLAGKGSQSEICEKYKITKKSTLQKWIKCYNSGNDFKEHSRSERGVTMKKKQENHFRGKNRDSRVLHSQRQGLRIDDREIRRIIPADLCVGAQIRSQGSRGTCRPSRQGKAEGRAY